MTRSLATDPESGKLLAHGKDQAKLLVLDRVTAQEHQPAFAHTMASERKRLELYPHYSIRTKTADSRVLL